MTLSSVNGDQVLPHRVYLPAAQSPAPKTARGGHALLSPPLCIAKHTDSRVRCWLQTDSAHPLSIEGLHPGNGAVAIIHTILKLSWTFNTYATTVNSVLLDFERYDAGSNAIDFKHIIAGPGEIIDKQCLGTMGASRSKQQQ